MNWQTCKARDRAGFAKLSEDIAGVMKLSAKSGITWEGFRSPQRQFCAIICSGRVTEVINRVCCWEGDFLLVGENRIILL